jgi:hypothetical protein
VQYIFLTADLVAAGFISLGAAGRVLEEEQAPP